MPDFRIQCAAAEVRTASGTCPGSGRCRKGDTYILGPRTPAGMCARAFTVVYPMAFAMRWTDRMDWEKTGHVDVICPDGHVTYRLTRLTDPPMK